jgi:hypothetical protein
VADIFSEVDEEVRRDQAEALWAKYANHVIAGALAVMLGIAAYWGWQKYQVHQQTQAAEAFFAATKLGGERSAEELTVIANGGGPFADLARLKLAGDAVLSGDRNKAKGIFAEIAGDESQDAAIRGVAALRGAYLELDASNPDAALALVADLNKEGNPYRLSAMEVAGLAALQAGDKAKAREIFGQIRDLAKGAGRMPAISSRAEQMLDRLAE